jgi:protein CpxP
MFSRNKLKLAGLALALLTAFGAAVQAQQTQPPTQNPTAGNDTQRRFGRGEGRRGMRRHSRPPLGAIRELNLSDEQKQQFRAIMERNMNSSKTQREELRKLGQKRFEGTLTAEEQARAKELHQQMAQSMQSAMTEVQGILTAEQKAKLQELKKERGPKHGGRGRRFGGPPPSQNNTTTPKP